MRRGTDRSGLKRFEPSYPKVSCVNTESIPPLSKSKLIVNEIVLTALYYHLPERSFGAAKLFLYYLTHAQGGEFRVSEETAEKYLNMGRTGYYAAKKTLRDLGLVQYERDRVVVDYAALFPRGKDTDWNDLLNDDRAATAGSQDADEDLDELF